MTSMLTQNEAMKSIILPILARYFTEHKQEIEKFLEQRLGHFDKKVQKQGEELATRLTIPVTEPVRSRLHIGVIPPTRSIGTNEEIYFQYNASTLIIGQAYIKSNGRWTAFASFSTAPSRTPRTSIASSAVHSHATYTEATGAVNGSNALYTMPTSYAAGTMRVYYRGSLQHDFTETDPSAGTVTLGFNPKASSQNNEVIFTYEQEN